MGFLNRGGVVGFEIGQSNPLGRTCLTGCGPRSDGLTDGLIHRLGLDVPNLIPHLPLCGSKRSGGHVGLCESWQNRSHITAGTGGLLGLGLCLCLCFGLCPLLCLALLNLRSLLRFAEFRLLSASAFFHLTPRANLVADGFGNDNLITLFAGSDITAHRLLDLPAEFLRGFGERYGESPVGIVNLSSTRSDILDRPTARHSFGIGDTSVPHPIIIDGAVLVPVSVLFRSCHVQYLPLRATEE